MKSLLHRILSPILALLVLVSTVSWTVDKHFCMGRVMDIAFFHHADRCGMEDALEMLGEKIEDKQCCDDESFTIEGQNDLKLSWEDVDLESQIFLSAFFHSYVRLASLSSERTVQEEIYPPPLLVHDLNILHEVFLI